MRVNPFRIRYSWMVGALFVLTMQVTAAGNSGQRLVAQNSGDAPSITVPRATSDSEKLNYSREAVAEMQGFLKTLSERIEDARRSKNISLLNQLNDAYGSINALLKVAETSLVLLEDAIAQNNALQAEHQFRKISIARSKAQQIMRNAAEFSGDDGPLTETDDGEVKLLVEEPLNPDQEIGTDPDVSGDPVFPAPHPLLRPLIERRRWGVEALLPLRQRGLAPSECHSPSDANLPVRSEFWHGV